MPPDDRGGGHSDQVVQQLGNIAQLLGRISQSLGSTTIYDQLFGSVQGSMIYRSGSAWTALAPGTANQRLITGGASANLAWGGGKIVLSSGSFPAATSISLNNIPAFYSYLSLQVSGVSSATATRHPRVQVSTDNGVSYDTTAANYIGAAAFTEASLFNAGFTDQAAAATWTFTCNIYGYQGGPNAMFSAIGKDSTGVFASQQGLYIGSTSAINAVSVLWNGSGNFDAGTYALYGIM